MTVLGITGGIATGKSTVLAMFAARGARVVSADAIARALTEPGAPLTAAVADAFPTVAHAAPDGAVTIDRRALADRIFAADDARRTLESILHPAIIQRLREEIDKHRQATEAGVLALEIPLLFEAGLEEMVDTILVVACSEAVQIERIRARLGIDEPAARRMLAAQWPLARKVDSADTVVWTDHGLPETERQVAGVWESLV